MSMADKLLELRQRFRGYNPVKTEDSDEESDEGIEMSLPNSSQSFLRAYRPVAVSENSSIPKSKSYFCKCWTYLVFFCVLIHFVPVSCSLGTYVCLCGSISGVVFLSIIAHMLESDYPYLKTGPKKTSLSGGIVGAIYLYILTAFVCLYVIISSPRIPDSERVNDWW